ncbi:hypothetical protein, partial [Vibrio parahaemolyticus]|uniref:hypothetical protein n=1 Tax=Vibrio parahaemolyticus TaxID=670 RepID=UPI0019D6F246
LLGILTTKKGSVLVLLLIHQKGLRLGLIEKRKRKSGSAICSMVCSMVCWSAKNAPRSSDNFTPRVCAKSHLGKFIFALGCFCVMLLFNRRKKNRHIRVAALGGFFKESGILWHVRKNGAN